MRTQLKFLSCAFALGVLFSATASATVIEIGDNSSAQYSNDIAIGDSATAGHNIPGCDPATCTTTSAIAIGRLANAQDGIAIGDNASTNGGLSVGQNTVSSGGGAAFGDNSNAGTRSVAVGLFANSPGSDGVAVGYGTDVAASNGTALGSGARVLAGHDGSVALGQGTATDAANQVAVGYRRVSQVEDGTVDTDAVNLRQLVVVDTRITDTRTAISGIASWFGGGAAYNAQTNAFAGPNYTFISGANFTNVGTALADLDARLHAVEILPPGGAGTPGPVGPQGPTGQNGGVGPQGPAGQDGADGSKDPLAVRYDDADKDSVTLEGANGTRISNVSEGVAGTDAVNVNQMRAADAWTLTQANSYTDRQIGIVNNRIDGLDTRVSGVCAMGSAQGQMAASAGANPSTHKVSVGVGFCGGSSALSAGYQQLYRTKKGRIGTFSLGVSASGRDTAIGAGWSMGW